MIVTKLNLLLNVPIEGYCCIRVVASVSTSLADTSSPYKTNCKTRRDIEAAFLLFFNLFFYSHYSIYLIICICTRFLWYAFNQFNLLYHLALLQRCCIYYVPRSYAISLRIFDQYEIFLQYNYSLFLKQHSEEINFTYITNKSILYRTIYVILLVIYYSIH